MTRNCEPITKPVRVLGRTLEGYVAHSPRPQELVDEFVGAMQMIYPLSFLGHAMIRQRPNAGYLMDEQQRVLEGLIFQMKRAVRALIPGIADDEAREFVVTAADFWGLLSYLGYYRTAPQPERYDVGRMN